MKTLPEKRSQNPPSQEKSSYPKSVFFIIGNEFCERFSYYGMRTVLFLFLTQRLLYSNNDGTMIFHVFAMACYFTPLLGAIIADSWLGKFKTIFYISIIYAIGNIMIAVGSIPNDTNTMKILSLVGLGLIALGTGGIKPCVAAFGGDQFEPHQEKQLKRFFSFFYMSINLGSVFSTFVTPLLREEVYCFGHKCWFLSFGVPAVLMIVSLVVFLLGKPLYKITPPKGNILPSVIKCIGHGISQKIKSKEKNREHWLDYADDAYDAKFIKDVKTVLHILLLYIPLPVFWALFDQQGSKWTYQATLLDGRFFGYVIKPDQMQFINPFLVILLVPVFEYAIYPILGKCHILVKPLHRVTAGGLVAGGAFALAGFLQLAIEKGEPVFPEQHKSHTRIINNSPCNITTNGTIGYIQPYMDKVLDNILLGNEQSLLVGGCSLAKESQTYRLTAKNSVQTLMITVEDGEYRFILAEESLAKNEKGFGDIRFFFRTNLEHETNKTGGLFLRGKENNYTLYTISNVSDNIGVTDYYSVHPEKYEVYLKENNQLISEMEVEPGARYTGVIFQDPDNETNVHVKIITIASPHSIHLLLQVPQYALITIGEIMFSVTGLEFSYSQAPATMKSVLQAAWLITVALGNVIVVIVAKARLFEKLSSELFMYAVLMVVDMLVFAVMAVFYKYVDPSSNTEEENAQETKISNGAKTNPAYEEDTHF